MNSKAGDVGEACRNDPLHYEYICTWTTAVRDNGDHYNLALCRSSGPCYCFKCPRWRCRLIELAVTLTRWHDVMGVSVTWMCDIFTAHCQPSSLVRHYEGDILISSVSTKCSFLYGSLNYFLKYSVNWDVVFRKFRINSKLWYDVLLSDRKNSTS